MRRALLLTIVALACSAPDRPTRTSIPTGKGVDSVVLERTMCYGTCPAYRLTLTSTGRVSFTNTAQRSSEPRDPNDPITQIDSVAPATVDSISRWAELAGYFALPDSVDANSQLCPLYATDHPSIELAIFGVRTKRLHYYTGCHRQSAAATDSTLGAIQRLAARIDSAANAARWMRPGDGGRPGQEER